MQIERRYYQIICLAIFLCHLSAGLQFWLKREDLEAPPPWTRQFYILLSLSLLLSLLAYVYRDASLLGKLLFVAKLIIFAIIGYGEGPYLGVELTLFTLILIEISAYFHLYTSILLTTSLTIATLVNQQAIRAWGITLSQVSPHDLLFFALYSSIVSVLSLSLHHVARQLDTQTQVADRLNKSISQLIHANLGFQQYAATASEQSVVLERKRISRDIHDTAVHTFVNIIMLTESASDMLATHPQKLSAILQQVIAISKAGVQDTRQALRELRNIEEASPTGLKAILHLVKVFQNATGVRVAIDFGNLPWELPGEIERAVYRIVQEGLSNAFRHGKATEVDIRFWLFETRPLTELILRIRDNGEGCGEIKKGIGLHGMEERLKKLQGRFEAKSFGDGFEIAVWIPLRENLALRYA